MICSNRSAFPISGCCSACALYFELTRSLLLNLVVLAVLQISQEAARLTPYLVIKSVLFTLIAKCSVIEGERL